MADDLDRTGSFAGHKRTIVEQTPSPSETPSRRASFTAMRAQIPNALSSLRFVLAAIWVELAMRGHHGRAAFAVIAILGAGSDFIDGRIARPLCTASAT